MPPLIGWTPSPLLQWNPSPITNWTSTPTPSCNTSPSTNCNSSPVLETNELRDEFSNQTKGDREVTIKSEPPDAVEVAQKLPQSEERLRKVAKKNAEGEAKRFVKALRKQNLRSEIKKILEAGFVVDDEITRKLEKLQINSSSPTLPADPRLCDDKTRHEWQKSRFKIRKKVAEPIEVKSDDPDLSRPPPPPAGSPPKHLLQPMYKGTKYMLIPGIEYEPMKCAEKSPQAPSGIAPFRFIVANFQGCGGSPVIN